MMDANQITCILPIGSYLQDLKEEFVTNLVYPAVQGNLIYEVSDLNTAKQSLICCTAAQLIISLLTLLLSLC